MYLEHFSLKERPFSISPDPRFLFMSNRYREALTHLTYGVQEGGGFVLLTGEVGTGKTTVCRCLLQQLPENTRLAFVLNPKLNSLELLATICDELKVEYPENCQSLKVLTDKLTEYLLKCYQEGLTVVVMIDEAQNLEIDVMEQVRLLTNLETSQKKLLQVILVGQPELQEKLAKRELRQLAQRITARYHLRPLNLKETMAYILHRTRIAGATKSLFARSAIEFLHLKTQGIPRLVNTICDRALLAAATRHKPHVDKKLMALAVKEIMGESFDSKPQKSSSLKQLPGWVKASAAGVAGIALIGAAYWAGTNQNSSVVEEAKPISVVKQNNEQTNQNLPSTTQKPNQLSSQASLIEEIVGNEQWDSNGRLSFSKLLAVWQVEYSPFKDGDACDFAREYGLFCNKGRGNWQLIRNYNRPALLKFSAGLQGEFWALVKNLEGTKATLQVGEKESKVGLDLLSTIWTGEYQILWQAPEGYQGDIKIGDQGDAVYWLSQSLIWLSDSAEQPQTEFDQSLKDKLIAFQEQKDINADGIAGMQTILKVNAELLVGIPLLTQAN